MNLTLTERVNRLEALRHSQGVSGPVLVAHVLLDKDNNIAIDGSDVNRLRQSFSGQFSLRFQSTGDAANRAATRILLETVGATRANPYLVQFDQIILDPFTGPGEFYLDERDASDVPGGESTVTVGTKDGLSAGYTPGSTYAIKVDKIYTINFIPGTAGDGIYVINISALGSPQPFGVLPPAPAIRPPLQ